MRAPLALLLLLTLATPALAATEVTEIRLAPKIDLNQNSASFRDPVGGVAVEPPCSGASPTVEAGPDGALYLWFRVDSDSPVSLTATWNHLPEGVKPTEAGAWQETLRSRVEIPESKGFRVWLVKNMGGEEGKGRWIVTLARGNGEVVCSVPFRLR